MTKKFNKIPPITLMIWPYLFFLIAALPENILGVISRHEVINIYLVLTVVVYIVNIIYAICYLLTHHEETSCKQLAFWGMLTKLVHIPFYIIMLLAAVLSVLIMVVPVFVLLSPIFIILIIIVDILLMITSSTYGVCAIVRAVKEGILPLRKAVFHGILHYILVLDTISSIYIFVKIRKHFKNTDKADYNSLP